MLKGRFFYYLLCVNAAVNTTIYVPVILIDHQGKGALLSIFAAVVAGGLFLVLFNGVIKAYPSKGLPEMLSGANPFIRTGLLLLAAVSWFWAGLTMILAFMEISNRYINPVAPDLFVLFAFFLVIGPAIRMRSTSILFAVEIVLFIIAPFVFFVFYKGITSENLQLNGILATITHAAPFPHFGSVAAASFIFSGYANMIIFNRHFPATFRIKKIWLLTLIGLCMLLFTFFIPIGILGTAGVKMYPFPWVATADAIRLEFFVIERLLFLFLIIDIAISLLSIIIHWHVSLECLKALFTQKAAMQSKEGIISWLAVCFMILITAIISHFLNESLVFNFNVWFLNVRFLEEALLIAILLILARRRRKKS